MSGSEYEILANECAATRRLGRSDEGDSSAGGCGGVEAAEELGGEILGLSFPQCRKGIEKREEGRKNQNVGTHLFRIGQGEG